MPACTFFGHRDCPSSIKTKLHEALIDLIENHGVDLFYVGRQGAFDGLVHTVLKELQLTYPHIQYSVVLDRMPSAKDSYDYSNTLLPEGIETVHPRFAISWRNKWMIRQSDYVVTYITHSTGGAAQFAKMAEKQGKVVVPLVHLVDVPTEQ